MQRLLVVVGGKSGEGERARSGSKHLVDNVWIGVDGCGRKKW